MRVNKQWLFVVFIVAALCWANAVVAATIYVSQEEEVGDYETIQEAIDAAENGDIVLVADGTYTDTGLTWVADDGEGNVKHITVKSEDGPDSCIIDCQNDGRAFYLVNGQDENDVIDGFTIKNGSVEEEEEGGGGIYCYASSPTITNCTIKENIAYYGGGIYCENSFPVIANCIIKENIVWAGGGIHCGNSSPTITNCTFTENYAYGGGGGIACWDNSSPTITNCTIKENETEDAGGGILCYASFPTITNCTIKENWAYGEGEEIGGGGIVCYGSSPTITGCTIKGNHADDAVGGGISCYTSSPTVTNCTIKENYAYVGGGIDSYISSLLLTNCTIVENEAEDYGGGVSCLGSFLLITNCTIAENEAVYSGGIDCWNSSSTIKNSILWENYGEAGISLYSDDPIFLTILIVGYSDVEGGEDGVDVEEKEEGICIINWGDGNIDLDPLFVKAAHYIEDDAEDTGNIHYHLSKDSLCIDKGTNEGAPDNDIDGQGRPFNERVDMGSDEYVWVGSGNSEDGQVNSYLGEGAFTGFETLNEEDLPDTGKPEMTFPFGFSSFRIIDIDKGETVTVVLTFSENVPTNAEYWKYDEITEEWYQLPFGSNDGDNVITLTLTDGGDGDADGEVNGVIVDPGGIGWEGAPNPEPGDDDDEDDKSCFIESVLGVAKASEEIMLVRRFRDENLLANPVGKVFVSTYYKVSPLLAGFIRGHSVLRGIAREMLRPLIWMSKEIVE